MTQLPLPPVELRMLVGPTEDAFFDNPSGAPVFGLPAAAYDTVLDWGCGCGRLARQLIQQTPRPRRYLGLDLHRGMVEWCRQNLAPQAPGFEFVHHDVVNLGLNPGGTATMLPFPIEDHVVSLFIAWSVFTHVTEAAALYYLGEVARVLAPNGTAMTTWFLFDKTEFPMMQDFQNALFINDVDPTNAVIFDKAWLRENARRHGLALAHIAPPTVRGFQWKISLAPLGSVAQEAAFPEDTAAAGVARPPLMPPNAPNLGPKPA